MITGGDVCVIDPATRQIVRRMGQGANFADVIALSPDGKTIASTGVYDERIRLWDAETGQEKLTVGHLDEVRAVAFSPDGKVISTASGGDGTVRLWDPGTGNETASLTGHKGTVFTVAFSPDGKWLASGGEDGSVRLWDVDKKEERQTIRVTKGRVTAVAFSPDGRSLFTGGIGAEGNYFDGQFVPNYALEQIREWSTETGQEIREPGHRGSALAVTSDGRFLCLGTMRIATVINSNAEGPFNAVSGNVALVDAKTGTTRLTVDGHGWVSALSADGRLLATAGGSDFHAGGKTRPERGAVATATQLRLWEVLSGQEVLRFAGDPPAVLAFTPDGRHLLFGTRTGAVCLAETTPPDAAAGGRLDRKALEAFWADLASDDAAMAYRAEVALSAAREDAPAFLAERLSPASPEDAEMKRLIADLSAERYVVRRAAFDALAQRGAEAELALRAALPRAESPRVKRQLEELLAAPGIKDFPAPLRRLRAAAVLERTGTPEAKRVLMTLPPVAELHDP